MQLQILNALAKEGVQSVEIHEASFKELKEQLADMFPESNTINYKKENGNESITVFGIKVWYKIKSSLIVN